MRQNFESKGEKTGDFRRKTVAEEEKDIQYECARTQSQTSSFVSQQSFTAQSSQSTQAARIQDMFFAQVFSLDQYVMSLVILDGGNNLQAWLLIRQYHCWIGRKAPASRCWTNRHPSQRSSGYTPRRVLEAFTS